AATIVRARPGAVPLPPGPVAVVTDLASPETADRLAEALRAAGRPCTTGEVAAAGVGAIGLPIAGSPGDRRSRHRRHDAPPAWARSWSPSEAPPATRARATGSTT